MDKSTACFQQNRHCSNKYFTPTKSLLFELLTSTQSQPNVFAEQGRFQAKTNPAKMYIAFFAFFKILDKDEDNASLGYHCGVKFQGDKIWHVLDIG